MLLLCNDYIGGTDHGVVELIALLYDFRDKTGWNFTGFYLADGHVKVRIEGAFEGIYFAYAELFEDNGQVVIYQPDTLHELICVRVLGHRKRPLEIVYDIQDSENYFSL